MNEKAERYRGTDKCNCPRRLAFSLDPDQWTSRDRIFTDWPYRRLRLGARDRPVVIDRPVTSGVTLPPSLIATMSAMVMRSSTSETASRTLIIVKRTAQAFTLLQSGHGV